MEGQDVVYKDVIEPLESVSVSLVSTEKTDVGEFGEPREVALTLADKVLTAPSQEVQLLNVGEVRRRAGRAAGGGGGWEHGGVGGGGVWEGGGGACVGMTASGPGTREEHRS